MIRVNTEIPMPIYKKKLLKWRIVIFMIDKEFKSTLVVSVSIEVHEALFLRF